MGTGGSLNCTSESKRSTAFCRRSWFNFHISYPLIYPVPFTVPLHCHSERSEESPPATEILRCAQNDSLDATTRLYTPVGLDALIPFYTPASERTSSGVGSSLSGVTILGTGHQGQL